MTVARSAVTYLFLFTITLYATEAKSLLIGVILESYITSID